MGVSTDAMLVYGYIWEDETELFPNDDTGEWEEVLLRKRGIVSPWDSFPAEIDDMSYEFRRDAGEAWRAEHRAELDAWYASQWAVKEEFGVEVDRHGSDQWSVPIIKIADVEHRAPRGRPQKLTALDLSVGPEWDSKLQRFIEALDIDTSEAQGPGWFLVSWWG